MAACVLVKGDLGNDDSHLGRCDSLIEAREVRVGQRQQLCGETRSENPRVAQIVALQSVINVMTLRGEIAEMVERKRGGKLQ